MRFADRNRIAFGSLVRAPLRTAMLLLATAIGVAAVVTLTALGEAARRYVTAEFQSLGTHLVIVLPGRSETTGGGPAMIAGATSGAQVSCSPTEVARTPAAVNPSIPRTVGTVSVTARSAYRDTR